MKFKNYSLETFPYRNQKAGTSGLRKKVSEFEKKYYLENYIQSIFYSKLFNSNSEIVIGSDGRYFSDKAILSAVRICVGNNIQKIFIGKFGFFSTPAVSNFIRIRNASGGIIFSASHNIGGKNGDFGVKVNSSSGAPISQRWTEKIYKNAIKISNLKYTKISNLDLNDEKIFKINNTTIEIVDPIEDYVNLLQKIFDFDSIKKMFKNGFKFSFNAMHGITGPYALKIFCDILKVDKKLMKNCIPKNDFGGICPDPCFKNAEDFYKMFSNDSNYDMGALSDGDGDRNVILGKNFEINSSDSLAILLYYSKDILTNNFQLTGVGRSFPTSRAVDQVANYLKIPIFETPTGWKFFANLLETNLISICGEESSGHGSNHLREKDGLWAILFWLNIIAFTNKSIEEIVNEHWNRFGRFFYKRFDIETLSFEECKKIFENLNSDLLKKSIKSKYEIEQIKDFQYYDPVEKKIYKNEGKIIFLSDPNIRVLLRMSGTSSKGNTLRIYIECFSRHYKESKFFFKKILSVKKKLLNFFDNLK